MPASLPRPLRQAALLLVALASGCASSQEQFAPVCPRLSLLRDAGDLTRFAGPEGADRAHQRGAGALRERAE
jgi:hypothetical protein